MRREAPIYLADHGNPDRAAAARQEEILLRTHQLVKIKRLLQREDISKQRHLHHAREAQRLKCRTQPARRDPLAELADEGRSNERVDRRILLGNNVQHGQNILALRELLRFAGVYAQAAPCAGLLVDFNIAIFISADGMKRASALAGGFPLPAVAGGEPPDRGVALWVKQAVKLVRVKIKLFHLAQRRLVPARKRAARKLFIKGIEGFHNNHSSFHGGLPLSGFSCRTG